MKRKILLFLVLISLFLTGNAMAAEKDVRNVNWGMTKQQVMNAEKNAIFKMDVDGRLIYRCVLNEKNYTLLYDFPDGRLREIYIFSDTDLSFYDDYAVFQQVLSKKHGSAVYKDYSDYLTTDIFEDGEYTYETYSTAWETQRTRVYLGIFSRFVEELGADAKNLVITYKDNHYEKNKEKSKYNNTKNSL